MVPFVFFNRSFEFLLICDVTMEMALDYDGAAVFAHLCHLH